MIQTEKYVVAMEVIIPIDDPSEPGYESETVQPLREIKEHAEREDLAWLIVRGKVYAVVGAASDRQIVHIMC
jgi:cytochrome b involved in lipid metabolism